MPAATLHNDPIPFITLPNWVQAAAQCGFNIQPIFRELEISTDLVHLESATIGRAQLEQVMGACVARARQHPNHQPNHQHFPFVLGETFAFEYLPDLQTFLTTSPTLRECLRVFDWVRELINPMINVFLIEESAQARLVLRIEDEQGRQPSMPWFTEATMASIVKFGRLLLGERANLQRLCFRHAAPEYVAEYEKYFRLPIDFNATEHGVLFERALLDMQLDGGFPALHKQAEYRVEQRLTKLPQRQGLIASIQQAYARKPQLMGQGIESMAQELGVGARTLQRRLREEGQNYAALQADCRYQLAMKLLQNPAVDMEAVSDKLGFSDRRSFTRAFTRWSGVSPSEFRKRDRPA